MVGTSLILSIEREQERKCEQRKDLLSKASKLEEKGLLSIRNKWL